jgi:hypothetical protein
LVGLQEVDKHNVHMSLAGIISVKLSNYRFSAGGDPGGSSSGSGVGVSAGFVPVLHLG